MPSPNCFLIGQSCGAAWLINPFIPDDHRARFGVSLKGQTPQLVIIVRNCVPRYFGVGAWTIRNHKVAQRPTQLKAKVVMHARCMVLMHHETEMWDLAWKELFLVPPLTKMRLSISFVH